MLEVCQVIGETCLVSTPLPLDPDPNTSFTRFTLLAPDPGPRRAGGHRAQSTGRVCHVQAAEHCKRHVAPHAHHLRTSWPAMASSRAGTTRCA